MHRSILVCFLCPTVYVASTLIVECSVCVVVCRGVY